MLPLHNEEELNLRILQEFNMQSSKESGSVWIRVSDLIINTGP